MKREPGLASDPCAVNEHDQLNIYTPEISLASENTVPTVHMYYRIERLHGSYYLFIIKMSCYYNKINKQ